MVTAGAARVRTLGSSDTVLARAQLHRLGFGPHDIDRQVAAGRWQRFGPAVVVHNAALTSAERRLVLVINCGPRALLTAFTAAEEWGLRGWERGEVDVLAPAGARRPDFRDLRLHRTGDWARVRSSPARRLHELGPALVIAAASFERPRPGCGLMAAAVQQRLLVADDLRRALHRAPRTRHRRALLLAVGDVEQGAQALSEIDFTRLCAHYGLPAPSRQAIRRSPGGRRRYLDVEWRLPGGRVVAVEVDGAHHIAVEQWNADQLRQNDVVIGGTLVLRYPSVVIRTEPEIVATQLRRVLLPN